MKQLHWATTSPSSHQYDASSINTYKFTHIQTNGQTGGMQGSANATNDINP